MKYMIDANVISHVVHRDVGYENIAARIAEVGLKNLNMSTLVAAELYVYTKSKKHPRLKRAAMSAMIEAVKIHTFSKKSALTAGALQASQQSKGKELPKPDFMIAGHAKQLGFVMVTDNVKDFKDAEGLTVENWRKPLA
ncbi:MAG: type II toxin-antitoxin system VapC family toxin [Sideroxydans sp.]|nr:type II toxin-antitoxin system VapC family toxin [Sideroxydans sp.]